MLNLPITVGKVWNVEYSAAATNRAVTVAAPAAFAAPLLEAGSTALLCNYKNFLKEIHYTAYTSFQGTTSTITSIKADIIYADLIDETCASTTKMFS